MKTVSRLLIVVTAVAALSAVPAWPQSRETVSQAVVPQDGRSNVPPKGAPARRIEDLRMERVPGESIPFPPIIRGWRQEVPCVANSPADVTGYRIECNNASYLDFQISDCCIASDHWQLKGKSWDKEPNTTVTTSPDLPSNGSTLYGLPARIYNYGGTGFALRRIDAYLECSYLNGVNLFPAGSSALLSSDGTCTVTTDATVRRIDRTP